MRNIIIGIIAREEEVNNKKIQVITNNNLKYLTNKCNYIGILNYDNSFIDPEVLEICDGIIFQGGKDIYPYHYQILEYAIKTHKPVLGICMGHQIIGLYSTTKNENNLIKVDNHNDKDKYHPININKNSILYKILNKDTFLVNTRHNYKLKEVKEPFKVAAVSQDNLIEAIEYIDDNNFILGLQFHPEDMDSTENIYNYFIKEVLKRKK